MALSFAINICKTHAKTIKLRTVRDSPLTWLRAKKANSLSGCNTRSEPACDVMTQRRDADQKYPPSLV